MSGPYESPAQARAAVRAAYDAARLCPGHGTLGEANRLMLESACRHAGVALGAYDDQIVGWLSKWEPETVAAIAGWVTRAAGGLSPVT